jgi:outer membrane protein TolC
MPNLQKNKFCKIKLAFICLVFVHFAKAQEFVLTLDNALDIVRKYHPMAKQTGLAISFAQEELRAARGAFDPSFYVSNQNKTFDGKNYFFYTNPELKIPTWFGIDLKAGLEDNGGFLLNTENTTGRSSYIGITVPVLKGLLFDKRRAAVQEAKLAINLSKQEQLLAVNDLLYDCANAYWAWVAAYQVNEIIKNAVAINENRLEFVRKSFQGGDRAAIDTTEALTQLQGFQFLQSQTQFTLQQKKLELSNFLWQENNTPYLLPEWVSPDSAWRTVAVQTYPLPPINNTIEMAVLNHPKLIANSVKLNMLAIERRAKSQALLPTLNLNYNFLNKGYSLLKSVQAPLFENNFKFGLEFGLPLFLRQARGELNQTKIKQNDLELDRNYFRLEIENKIKVYYAEMIALRNQTLIFEDNYKNFQKLLNAEEQKFAIGESSLFLINSRENKALETFQKLVELKTKFFKSLLALQWSAGQLR